MAFYMASIPKVSLKIKGNIWCLGLVRPSSANCWWGTLGQIWTNPDSPLTFDIPPPSENYFLAVWTRTPRACTHTHMHSRTHTHTHFWGGRSAFERERESAGWNWGMRLNMIKTHLRKYRRSGWGRTKEGLHGWARASKHRQNRLGAH